MRFDNNYKYNYLRRRGYGYEEARKLCRCGWKKVKPMSAYNDFINDLKSKLARKYDNVKPQKTKKVAVPKPQVKASKGGKKK